MSQQKRPPRSPASATPDVADQQQAQRPAGPYRHAVPSQPNPRGRAFAELIRAARKAAGLSQDEVAEAADVSRTTIIRWESGDATRPDSDQVRRVCAVIGLDPRRAAIALGYLTAEEVWGTEAPQPSVPSEIEEVLEILQDPNVDPAEKAAWVKYLRYIRDQSRQRSAG